MNKPSPSPLPIATGTTASGAAMVVTVCLPGPITTVITVRDTVGSPVANASLSAVLPGGKTQPLGTTDASGRLTTPVLAPATLRASVGGFSGALALSTLACVTETKAAATVFVKAPSYTPKYHFPWQNPIHRAMGGIYEDRTKLLRTAVRLMCNVSKDDAAALDHDACLNKLIAAYEAQSATTAAWAATSTVGPDGITQLAPIDIHADGPTFYEPWVWYGVIHYSGIRYKIAHGSFSPPGALVELLRAAEIAAQWPATSSASEDDVAEAMLLAPSVLGKKDLVAFSKDITVAKSAATACAKVFLELKKVRSGSLDDYAALGLLVARHALNPYPAAMWKSIVSHTQLRNDTDDATWSDTADTSTMAPYAAPMGSWRGQTFNNAWKSTQRRTLDIVTPWVVCNQLSEVSAAARGADTRGGLTGNATQAAAITPLRHITRDNLDQIAPGTHVFYMTWSKWDQQKGKEDPWATLFPVPFDWWFFRIDQKCPGGIPASFDTWPEPSSLEGDAPMMINRIKVDDPSNLDKVFVIPTLDQKNNQAARVALDKNGVATLYLLKWQHECVVIDTYTDKHGVFHFIAIDTGADGGTGLKDHQLSGDWTPDAVFGDVATTIDPNFEALRGTYLNSTLLRATLTT